MKKTINTIAALFVAATCLAQTEIYTQPENMIAKTSGKLQVHLPNAEDVHTLLFTITWPEGWSSNDCAVKNSDKYGACCSTDGQTTKYLVYSFAKGTPLAATDDSMLEITATAPNVEPGYYPVVINTEAEMTGADYGSRKIEGRQVSYVKIGQPLDATFAVDGILTSGAVEGLNDAEENSYLQLAKVDLTKCPKVNGNFLLVDKRSLAFPVTGVTFDGLAYKRLNGGANSLGSLILPFDASFEDKVCYTPRSVDDQVAVFTSTTTLAANTPAIVKTDDDIDVASEGEVMLTSASDIAPYTTSVGYYLSGHSIFSCNNTVVNPYRAVFDFGGAEAHSFVFDDETGIDNIVSPETTDGMTYNIAGQRVSNPKKGVYIVNSKKILINK